MAFKRSLLVAFQRELIGKFLDKFLDKSVNVLDFLPDFVRTWHFKVLENGFRGETILQSRTLNADTQRLIESL